MEDRTQTHTHIHKKAIPGLWTHSYIHKKFSPKHDLLALLWFCSFEFKKKSMEMKVLENQSESFSFTVKPAARGGSTEEQKIHKLEKHSK